MCDKCGSYRGRKLIDMDAVNAKKAERARKKAKSMGLDPDAAVPEHKEKDTSSAKKAVKA